MSPPEPAPAQPPQRRPVHLPRQLFHAFRLTRPRQWPILSAQLALGVAMAPAVAAGARLDPMVLLMAWLAWVVALNGGTLAFNSAYDRDEEDVAYLRRPPPPPSWLAPVAVGWMGLGVLAGWAGVAPAFAALVAGCLLLSVLYSHPRSRWKGRPGLDLVVNVLGYGCGTTLAGLLAGQAAAGHGEALPGGLPAAAWWLVCGFGLLFGSFYPLTQIYQLSDDLGRGDRTLSTALGPRRALGLAALLAVAAALCLLRGVTTGPWRTAATGPALWLLVAALLAWLIHIVGWTLRAADWNPARHERGMYHALALWAVIDLSLVAALYLD